MTTAAELLANPNLDIDPITARVASLTQYTTDELAVFRIGHDDVDDLTLKIYNHGGMGKNLRKNVRRFVTEATFEDTIDATPTFTMTLHDPDWELLNTGALEQVIDINPAKVRGRWYRLDSVEVNDDDITLVFQTRNAVYLSYIKRRRKANRKRQTRAQFIKSLVDEVKRTKIKFFCPQLDKRQKVATTRFPSQTGRKKGRQKGFTSSDDITVKNAPASQQQRDCIEQVISGGIDTDAPDLVIVAAIMTVIQESNAGANTGGNPPFTGPFQQAKKYGWPATGNAYKDSKGFYNKAIPEYKKNPNQDLGMMCQKIQGADPNLNPLNSGFAQECNQHRPEAEHAFSAYTGSEVGDGGANTEFKEKFEFMVGPPDGGTHENYLGAIYRLAEQVNWSAFWVGDELHYQSQEDLLKSKPRARLVRDADGIENISFGWDHSKRINRMTLQVRMDRWVAPIGTVVSFQGGGPAQGRWLVGGVRRSMFNELGEITLIKPMKEKKETANQPGSRNPNVGTGIPGDPTIDPDAPSKGIEDVKPEWTPEDIINKIVLPKARFYGMTNGHTPASVKKKNAAHSFYTASGNQSDHSGPPDQRWAADMAMGTTFPTDQMDNLAFDLDVSFQFPIFADPTAVEAGGNVPGNLLSNNDHYFVYQLIYRTADHWDHVHFGVHRVAYPKFGGPRP